MNNAIQKLVDLATIVVVLGIAIAGFGAIAKHAAESKPDSYHVGGPVERFDYVPGSHLLGNDVGAGPSWTELERITQEVQVRFDVPSLSVTNLR